MMDSLKQVRSSLGLRAGIIIGGILCVAFGVIFLMSETDQGRAANDGPLTNQTTRELGIFRPTAAQWATLTVGTVTTHHFRNEVLTEGKIAIDDDRATRLYSPYAGRVIKLLVAPGDTVKQGQAVFVIDAADSVDTQKDFVAALTQLNKARSQVNLTEVVERRMAALYKEKAMALKDWQEAQANLVTAQNDLRSTEVALEAVRNRLRLLGKTNAEIAAFEKTGVITPDAPVYSPLAGVVLQRRVGPGQYVDAGAGSSDPLYLVGDLSKVWLITYVRETDAGKPKIGQTVKFTVLAYPGQIFDGKLNFVAASLDAASRRLLVRASIDNSAGLLKPEMFASVSIVVDEGAPSSAVPRDAIIFEGDSERVWVVRDGNSIELRQIKTGLADGPMVQVLSGLKAGEKVITKGGLFIDRAATAQG